MEGEVQVLLALSAILAVGVCAVFWKQATLGAMLLLVLEGALRKWVWPEGQAVLYLVKDVVLLGAYLGFAARRVRPVRIPHSKPLFALVAVTALYGTAQVFNPALPTILLGLVGWKAYFFYVPLVFLVPHLFASLEELELALRRFAYLAIAAALLGLLQFYSPADSLININVQHEQGGGAAIGFGSIDRVRVAGPFSFISGFTAYLLAMALAIGACLAASRWRFKGNAALYAGIALVVAAMFATGSRGPILSFAIAAILYVAFSSAIGDLSTAGAVKAGIAAVALAMVVAYFLPEPAEAFRSRAAAADEDVLERAFGPLVEPFKIMEETGVMGFGIGAAHQSGPYLAGTPFRWWTDGLVAEAETSRVTIETGFLGLTLVFLFRIGIALAALGASLRFRRRQARVLALAIALFLGLQIMGAVIFNPTMNLLYWFAIGMLFALHRFEARSAQQAAVGDPAYADRFAGRFASRQLPVS
jgi:hypothetical protein